MSDPGVVVLPFAVLGVLFMAFVFLITRGAREPRHDPAPDRRSCQCRVHRRMRGESQDE